MAKYGLIGDPIATSRSPLLFEAAYKGQEQPDGSAYKYDLIEGSDFETSFKKFVDEYQAINVTAPFKELAYARVEELAEQGKGVISGPVARIGATNLLVKTSEGIAAHNSDFTGIVAAIAEAYYPGIVEEFIKEYGDRFFIKLHQFFLMSLSRRFYQQPQALIVGCGGAGRAAAVAAGELGFGTVLMNRTLEKAQAIAQAMPEYEFFPDPIKDFKEAVKECDLIIYTLPVALPEIEEFSADDFAKKGACDEKVIMEANYKNPSFDEIARAKIAAAEGIYIPGDRWLLYQALTGYHFMTGLTPDLKAMEAALLG
ncbi:MAG: hypothetical protein IJQ93_14195 [Bacteroidales bacterium]|nr:hypothetical protein [Bacteroidales bacterium]MBR0301450.1 hypothetical protein [Bacteroidales bacterium]